jgi:hypothetical protein
VPTFEQEQAARRAELARALAGADPDQPVHTCSCGREIRKLNYASDTPKCTCGFPPATCRCQPLTTEGSTTP